MRITFIISLFICALSNITLGQIKPEIINAHERLQKGLELYEAEKFEEALEQYKKVSPNDTAYNQILVEEILTYYQLKQYDKAIELARSARSLSLNLGPEFYTDLGCCYDNLNQYDEAIKVYEEGMRCFPKNNTLHFNKGYSLIQLKKHKEAFECYKKSMELNPFHPGTHYALGVLAMNEGKTSLAMLALSTYLLLDPSSSRSNQALVWINDMASTKYQEKVQAVGIDITDGDDFSEIDMLIHNYVALNKKYKVKSDLDIPLVKQDYLLFDKLPNDADSKGFWYKTYVPFYKQLLKDEKFEIFSIYLLQSSGNEAHQKTVKKNEAKISEFIEWIKSNWDNQHRTYEMPLNGKVQSVGVFRANKAFALSSIGLLNNAKDSYVGYAEFYHANGKLKGIGNFSSDGKRNGEWTWYNEDGELNEKQLYTNGEMTTSDNYSAIGIIQTHIPYKNEKIEGEAIAYSDQGAKSKLITFKAGEREGKYEEYYNNGVVSFRGNYSKGKLNGKAQSFYDKGELKSEVTYLDDQKNSEETVYYRNGKLFQKNIYNEGLINGLCIEYYKNGKIHDSARYVKGNVVGRKVEYFKTGVMSVHAEYDENGKITGIRKEFDNDGILYCELEYKKGEIIGYKYFNKKGEIIKQDKKKNGVFDFQTFSPLGIKKGEGKYDKDDRQGTWKYYDENGNLTTEAAYKNGQQQGETKHFFASGQINKTVQLKEGDEDGFYNEFFLDGNLSYEGNYKKGNSDGQWYSYYTNKKPENEVFYVDNAENGISKFYAVNGKLLEKKKYYLGTLQYQCTYDSLGGIIDSINYKNNTGIFTLHYSKGGAKKIDFTLKNGEFDGDYTIYFPDGKIALKAQYYNGSRHGVWTRYSWNGNLSSKEIYEYGEKTGKWETYDKNGLLKKITLYEDNKVNGKETDYFENGKIDRERNIIDDVLEGETIFYQQDGQIEHKRKYYHDVLMSYTCYDASGQEKTFPVALSGSTEIKVYYKNGKLARQFTLNKGLYQGVFNKYYTNGQLFETVTDKDNEEHGDDIYYYPDGKIKLKQTYYYGYLNGPMEEYYPNGKLKEKSNYMYGRLHGQSFKYDETGKQIAKLLYYNNDLIEISK